MKGGSERVRLLESGKIGKLLIRNRIVMAAMAVGALAEPDGRMSERLIDYYTERAKGGTGLIVTGPFFFREVEQSPSVIATLMADHDIHKARLNQLAESVHDYGAKIAVQLAPGRGRNATPNVLRTVGAVGPSPNPPFFNPRMTARALTIEEVERLVQAFGSRAQFVRDAGIDGVEINGHGGYLFDEFTSPLWNRRTDKYGGSLEGRLRFSVEAIEAIKKGAGADFPVLIKFALTHYIPGGRDIEEGLEIARRWEEAGVDALVIDAGCYEVRYWPNPPTTQPMGCMVDLAAMVKKVVKIPVIAVGKLGAPELAEGVLQDGKADFIALGRPLLADPEWANKVKERRLEDIRPCIGCHEGCHKRLHERKFLTCTVNPACGREKEFMINPAEKKKCVLVIGGGPGGMEAARIAALRGHRVALWEKGNTLGGNLIPAAVPNFKREYGTLINYLSTQIKKVGVDINLGKEATPELIEEINPEAVFIATGSIPIFPVLPRVEREKVVTAVDLLLGKREAGQSVVVIGGGLVGCETALYLTHKGKKVILLEILDSLMCDVYSINRMHLEKLLADSQVEILTKTELLEITDKGIVIADKDGRRSTLEADTVVFATGFEPNDTLFKALKGKVPELYSIGDCVVPRKATDAISEGFRIGRLI